MTIGKIRKEIEARVKKLNQMIDFLQCDVDVWRWYEDIEEVLYRQKKIKEEKEKLERALEVLK